MIHRFSDFELDSQARELRLNGQEIRLQPRVFDLLAYLIEHRDRVVGKDELLDALWPGVIVTEASLQRAISLARAALQQGGLGGAIRTYSRYGYRFSVDFNAVPPTAGGDGESGRADALFEQRRWAEAANEYQRIDIVHPLDAAGLERWGVSALCMGGLSAAVGPFERAAAAYGAGGDAESAARVLLLLTRARLELMEMAVASGCLRRAASLLVRLPQGEQHGHLAWTRARVCVFEGDMTGAVEHARHAISIGRALQNLDIETLGLLYWGIAMQASGETRLGVDLQDEAAAAVLSGGVSPMIGGIVYCGLIAGCCNRGDWPRADQWTESFTRWCERESVDTFAGVCLLHRAEVYVACGELDKAEREIEQSNRVLHSSAPWAVGDAYRLLGDLQLARGDFDAAEDAYRRAHEHGWDPYPGYAMLLHYRGRSAEAIRGLRRAAEPTHWVAGERKACYLAHTALLAAQAGEPQLAQETLAELDARSERWDSGAVAGQVHRARGELSLASGDYETAVRLLRQAVRVLQDMRAPLEAAVVRIRLAEAYAQLRERECVELELSAAESVFRRVGASWYLRQCHLLRQHILPVE